MVLVLTYGIKRAELWAHRGMRQRLQQVGETSSLGSLPTSFGLILGALVWLVVALRL